MGAMSFGASKQIEAGVLNIAYIEAGAQEGPVAILLHGWPYDIHTFADVAPLLASAGFRVIVPYLRGYGATTFRSVATVRNGQQAAVAVDTVALMDALKIEKALLAGCDWGARAVNVISALWPERCTATVSVSGYLIGSQEANKKPLPPKAELAWWYQYYFATERGRAGYTANTRDFAQLIWRLASPHWHFDDSTFDRSAAALTNPDHADIVIHNYRWRLGLAEGEALYDDFERTLAGAPPISVPTITLEGDANGAPHPDPAPIAQVLRQVRTPDHQGRHRAQPAPGSSASFRRGRDRRRPVLIGSVRARSGGLLHSRTPWRERGPGSDGWRQCPASPGKLNRSPI